MSVYINGADDSSSSQSNTAALYETDLLICNLASSTSFDGEVSELRVWSTARSSAEISANYARRMTGNEEGLLYCWPMDDGPGSASCRELVSGAAAAIAIDKVTNNQVVFLDTMLPHVLFRQTLAADTSDTLSIRPGTLTVPANADVTLPVATRWIPARTPPA